MTASPDPSKSRGLPWGRIVLFASLALNLLVVGLVAGAMLRHDRFDSHPPLRDLGYGPFGEALSPTDRRALARGLIGHAGDLQANRDDIRRQFAEMLAVLRARPFDAKALAALVQNQQIKLKERQAIGQTLLLDRIEAMSDEERAAFADRLEQNLRRAARDRRH